MCGYDSDYFNSVLLHWDGQQLHLLWEEDHPNRLPYFSILCSLWMGNSPWVFVVNNTGLFKHSLLDLTYVVKEEGMYFQGANRIRGSDINNIFVVANRGDVWHFNGKQWHPYLSLQNQTDYLKSVSVTEELVCAVGTRYLNGIERFGVIYLGRR